MAFDFDKLKGEVNKAVAGMKNTAQDQAAKAQKFADQYREEMKGVQFSTGTKVACGAVGLAGVGMILAGGTKRDVKNDVQEARENGTGIMKKPLQRMFKRLCGIGLLLLSADMMAKGDQSIIGKHTANFFAQKQKAAMQTDQQVGI